MVDNVTQKWSFIKVYPFKAVDCVINEGVYLEC